MHEMYCCSHPTVRRRTLIKYCIHYYYYGFAELVSIWMESFHLHFPSNWTESRSKKCDFVLDALWRACLCPNKISRFNICHWAGGVSNCWHKLNCNCHNRFYWTRKRSTFFPSCSAIARRFVANRVYRNDGHPICHYYYLNKNIKLKNESKADYSHGTLEPCSVRHAKFVVHTSYGIPYAAEINIDAFSFCQYFCSIFFHVRS